MENPVQNIPENEKITQHNALVHSRQTFTLLQQRILALAVAQIQRSDDGKEIYKVRIRDLIELGTSTEIYSRLNKEAKDLVGKVVTRKGVKSNGKRFFEHWSMLKKASYEEGTGILEVQFHSEIQQMLFDLKGEFSSAVAVEKASCQSVYGVRIYEMLVSHWRFGEWEVPVEDLRHSLGLEDKYKNFSHFRTRVLKKAQKDVQKHTNMRFTWKELKRAYGRGKGKKITHIKFDFSWKPDQMNLLMEQPKKKSKFDIYDLRNRLKKYAKLEQKKINKILRYLEKNPDDREGFKQRYHHVEANIQQGTDDQNRQINSVSGYAWSEIKSLIEK